MSQYQDLNVFQLFYLVKQKEGHLFRNEENRLDFYRHLEVFLAKHLQN